MQTHSAASSRDIFSGNLERSAPSIDRLLDHVELVDNVNEIAQPEGSRLARKILESTHDHRGTNRFP